MVLFGDNHWDIGVGEDGWDVEAGNGCVWEDVLREGVFVKVGWVRR